MTMEDMICRRYETLLQSHLQKAFKKSRYTTLLFAASDSVGLLCMALTFWYGGQLLADRTYQATQFFIVYLAVVNGSESAGSLLSFGPSKPQNYLPDSSVADIHRHGTGICGSKPYSQLPDK
jgi:ATP-binding cassette subfamily B (MDR/TAP) protein 1